MVFDQIADIISQVLNIDKSSITMNTLLNEDLKADSIDKAELVTEIEDKLNIIIDYDQALAVKSVGDIVNAIEKLV